MSRFALGPVILAIGIGVACAAPIRLREHANVARSLSQSCQAENTVCNPSKGCCEGLNCAESPWEGEGVSTCQIPARDCTPDGERARGAAGEAYVAYAPCCSGQLPVLDPEKGHGDWCPSGGESGGGNHDGNGDGCGGSSEDMREMDEKMNGGNNGGNGEETAENTHGDGEGEGKDGENGQLGNPEAGEAGKEEGFVDEHGNPIGGKEHGGDEGEGGNGEGGEGGEGGAPMVTVTVNGEGDGKHEHEKNAGDGDLGAITMPDDPPPVNWEMIAQLTPGRAEELLEPV